MRKSAKIILPISLIVIVFGIVGIINGWNNVQNRQREANNARADLIKTCQDEKAAMLNPDLPTETYQNNLAHYNAVCANYAGALK
jgi:hypothetical protein